MNYFILSASLKRTTEAEKVIEDVYTSRGDIEHVKIYLISKNSGL